MKEKSIIAVTGPSGAGKTTLVNELSKRHNLAVPKHCTTREPRGDDNGLYRYLTHEEYFIEENSFSHQVMDQK